MVLVAVVVVGILAEAATLLTSRMTQADREQELLFRGLAYKKAVESYYRAGGSYPRALDDLLKDPRTPGVRRHIRALYPDPFARSDKKEWTLIRAADGGITGVAEIHELDAFDDALAVGIQTRDDAPGQARLRESGSGGCRGDRHEFPFVVVRSARADSPQAVRLRSP